MHVWIMRGWAKNEESCGSVVRQGTMEMGDDFAYIVLHIVLSL